MSRIYVIAASKMEADPVARMLGVSRWDTSSHAGPITAGPNQLDFFVTGMGPKKTRERAAEIFPEGREPHLGIGQQHHQPDVAIIIGLCGGLIDSLPETTIVIYSSCLSLMNGGIPCSYDHEPSERITSLLNAQKVPCKSVVGITSPRIAITKDQKLQLARTGAQVVDMESYEILSAAHKSGIPAAVVRVVSDSLDRKLPDFNCALNPNGL
jgi:phosphorylase superfamily protein